ncbi:MAG: crotonase [Alphaproteobacteria bacterium]|nr:crotonase [Alphaproteobacteria bacterium]
MSDEVLISERIGAVERLTINRPAALNALNASVLAALKAAFERIARDDAIRAIVLTGAGEKSFVAGADIKEMATIGPLEAEALARSAKRVHDAIIHCPKPVIAAINGFALGGGFELALVCDIRIAADDARFGLPEVKLAVLPGGGGIMRLSRLVGPSVARALCLTGDMISAERAFQLGIVSELVAHDKLDEHALKKAEALAALSPVALAQIKSALEIGANADLESALAAEAKAFALCFAAADQKEGMAAFIEKRPARFTGR